MATEKKESDGRTVLLKHVRLSFTDSLLEKKATSKEQPDKLSHGCNFILETKDKNFEANKAKVMAAIRAAGEEQWKDPDKWKEIAEEAPKRVCFRKGERFKNQSTGEPYAGYAGNYAISAKGPSAGNKRPKLLDRTKRPHFDNATAEDIKQNRFFRDPQILDIFYGGSYADAYVSFYGTDKGSAGIFASIELIRSHQEGERMGNSAPDLDLAELEDLEDDDTDLMEGAGGASDDDDLL